MRLTPFIAFFLSGTSSLIFQLIWSRLLHHVFGSSSVAISSVVSVFMGGLALGAWLFGKYADRLRNPLLWYAAAEVGVGVCGLLVPLLVQPEGWLATVNAMLRQSLGTESLGFMVARFLCVVPVLIVPTTLMGSTLPLLARHFVQAEQKAGAASSSVGALYAVNTFGAVFGIFLAGFIWMPTIGVSATNTAAAVINFALAAMIFLLRKNLLAAPPRQTPEVAASDSAEHAPLAPVEAAPEIPRITRIVVAVCFGVGGVASLFYEVVWSRALINTIGGSVYSFALILMTFLIGIASGSAVASSILRSASNSLTGIAAASGMLALLVTAPLSLRQGIGTWLGALAGALVLIGLLRFLAQSRAKRTSLFDAGLAEDPPGTTLWGFAILLVPVATGLAVLSADGDRVVKMTLSVVASVALLFALLLGLRKRPVLLVATLQLFIAGATFVSDLWAGQISLVFAGMVAPFYDSLPDQVNLIIFLMFLTAALCVLPAALGMGAMFPITLRVWTSGGQSIGRDVSVVYTGNTIGSIVGAWLPGFILMPTFGMQGTMHIGIALNLLLALAVLLSMGAKTEAAKAAANDDEDDPLTGETVAVYLLAPLIPALIALLYVASINPDSFLRWNLSKMTLGAFRLSLARDVLDEEAWGEPDLVYYRDGLSTTVSVERWGRHYALKNNGKVDASNGDDMPTQIMVAGFPLLMHAKGPKDLDVAVIGFGSGVTVGTVLQFPVKSVDTVELERSIPEASKFFSDVNHLQYTRDTFPFIEMPRLTLINDDGRNYLAATDKTYDVIVSEPSNPWLTGVSDLFTIDHFRITKRKLRKDGIYCQWVQLYEMSPENVKTIYRTFASQFKHVLVFSAEDRSSDTVLLGSDSPLPLDYARVNRAFALPGVEAELERAYIHSPFDVFARILLASRDEVMTYTQYESRLKDGRWEQNLAATGAQDCPPATCRRTPAPLNTDDNALIEFAAPRDLIGFQRYSGYLDTIYAADWPYGKLVKYAAGFGAGEVASARFAEQAMALVAHGRKVEATNLIEHALKVGKAPETEVALTLLSLLMDDTGEPRVKIEAPVPGPELTPESANQLTEGFDAVKKATERKEFALALTELEAMPSPLRMHSGPDLRLLYGYLLYKNMKSGIADPEDVVDELEDLIRTDAPFAELHPEIYYFLARAHDRVDHYDKAVRNMRRFVESRPPLEPVLPPGTEAAVDAAVQAVVDAVPSAAPGGRDAGGGEPVRLDPPSPQD